MQSYNIDLLCGMRILVSIDPYDGTCVMCVFMYNLRRLVMNMIRINAHIKNPFLYFVLP